MKNKTPKDIDEEIAMQAMQESLKKLGHFDLANRISKVVHQHEFVINPDPKSGITTMACKVCGHESPTIIRTGE